jgi:hypothetical protein
MILQLNPPLPVITPRGSGLAHLVIDYGPEAHLLWTVFLDDSAECWTFPNPQIRAAKNITMGRCGTAPAPSAESNAQDQPAVRTVVAPWR